MKRAIVINCLTSNCLTTFISGGLTICVMFVFSMVGLAQGDRHHDYDVDKTLHSNARVNPSTLAMELSIPLVSFPGRAGNSAPVMINYSSKVWEFNTTWTSSNPQVATRVDPRYSLHSAAGWSSTLNVPRIDYDQYDREKYYIDDSGTVLPYTFNESPYSIPLYYVKRVRVVMPGGATVEFRKDDAVYGRGDSSTNTPADIIGTFLSVDGSRMRLEMGTPNTVLYLPDGGRYIFAGYAPTPQSFIDRHGNQTSLNETQTTDTLGRPPIANPIPLPLNQGQVLQTEQTVGMKTYSYPGINGALREFKLIWGQLNTVLSTGESLRYLGDYNCGPSPPTFVANALFQSQGFLVCGGHALSNPVVLAEVQLPDGSAYRFKYNSYGEITRIDYPLGGYERFEYINIKPVGTSVSPYDQSNRGVKFRWVSEGDGVAEKLWTYQVEVGTWQNPTYLVRTIAPDLSYTEQMLHNETNEGTLYGFGLLTSGRAFETRIYSSSNILLSRKLTKWTQTGALTVNTPPGDVGAKRDLRPEKEISIIFKPGNSYALAAMTETVYDTSGSSDPAYFSSLNPKQIKNYHYVVVGSSAAATANITTAVGWFLNLNPATVVETNYLYDSSYKSRNITGIAAEMLVKDASGDVKAKSQISYDESGYSLNSSGTMPASAANSWLDPVTELGSTLGAKRGLPTTVKTYSDVPANQYVETHTFYDQYGNVRRTRDALTKDTDIEYDPGYAFAYPTKVIAPAAGDAAHSALSTTAFFTTAIFDYSTGLPLSTTDANGQTTLVSYADPTTLAIDPMLRVRKVTAPNGQQTITDYGTPDGTPGGTGQLSAAQRFVHTKMQLDQNSWAESWNWADGLGRAVKSQKKDAAGDVFAFTFYDTMGRVSQSSNPIRNPSSSPTCGTNLLCTTTQYDELGRVKEIDSPLEVGQTTPAKVLTSFNLATTGSAVGTTVTVTDQAGKLRRSITNALGQLIRVDEPDATGALDTGSVSAPKQPTTYTYDTLGNLLTVVQAGNTALQCTGSASGATTSCSQQRTFVYDSLSHLKSASDPESGLISYSYDANGNLLTKTDARWVKTSFSYDNLNRVVTRSYGIELGHSAPTDNYAGSPNVDYYYDGKYFNYLGQAQTATGAVNGKLTSVKTATSPSVSYTNYRAFDSLGRTKASQQITDGTTYDFSDYSYNLAGALISETYPSLRQVRSVLNADGDLAGVSSRTNATNPLHPYASGFSYTAAGAVSSMQLGNNRWETTAFNNRLQPVQMGLGTSSAAQDLWRVNYEYGTVNQGNGIVDITTNNGNVGKQIITTPSVGVNQGFTATQYYGYDELNRLASVAETLTGQGGSDSTRQTFLYDRSGNRHFDTGSGNTTTIPTGCPTAVCNPTADPFTNRFAAGQGYSYDAAGNLTQDASLKKFTYDGENKQTKVETVNSNGVVTSELGGYVYDGDGKRIKKIAGAETTIFVYDASGKMVAEYSTLPPPPPTQATTSYLTNDHLGSPRVITDQTGIVTSRRDFLPFGDDLSTPQRAQRPDYASDTVRQKFTGYQKDEESELEYAQARYYNPKHGRFISPDDFFNDTHASDPQSWNLYAYVRNNPLVFVDPTGMSPTDFINYETGERTHIEDLKDQVITASTKEIKSLSEKFNNNRENYYNQLRLFEKSRNNLHMTSGELDNLAGVIYSEASKNSTNWAEAAGIYGVLRNRAIADENSVLDQANDTTQVFGSKNKDQIFDPNVSKSKLNAVYKGIALSVAYGKDYSNGAYFWHGTDFGREGTNANNAFYQTGFHFNSPSHDLWGMGDHISGNKSYDYTYESTAAYGQTTFIKITEAWMKANGANNWRGGRK